MADTQDHSDYKAALKIIEPMLNSSEKKSNQLVMPIASECYVNLEKYTEAETFAKKALILDLSSFHSWNQLAKVQISSKQYSSASASFIAAHERVGTVKGTSVNNLAAFYREWLSLSLLRNDFQTLGFVAQNFIEICSSSTYVWICCATIMAQTNPASSLKMIQALCANLSANDTKNNNSKSSNNSDLLLRNLEDLKAKILLEIKKYTEALEFLSSKQCRIPNLIKRKYLYETYKSLGENEKARDICYEIFKSNPENFEFLCNYIQLCDSSKFETLSKLSKSFENSLLVTSYAIEVANIEVGAEKELVLEFLDKFISKKSFGYFYSLIKSVSINKVQMILEYMEALPDLKNSSFYFFLKSNIFKRLDSSFTDEEDQFILKQAENSSLPLEDQQVYGVIGSKILEKKNQSIQAALLLSEIYRTEVTSKYLCCKAAFAHIRSNQEETANELLVKFANFSQPNVKTVEQFFNNFNFHKYSLARFENFLQNKSYGRCLEMCHLAIKSIEDYYLALNDFLVHTCLIANFDDLISAYKVSKKLYYSKPVMKIMYLTLKICIAIQEKRIKIKTAPTGFSKDFITEPLKFGVQVMHHLFKADPENIEFHLLAIKLYSLLSNETSLKRSENIVKRLDPCRSEIVLDETFDQLVQSLSSMNI